MVGLVEGLAGAMLLDPEGSTIWRTTLPLDSVEGICTLSGGGFAVSGDVGGLATVLTLDAEGRGEWNTERSGTGESFVPDI